MLNCNPYVPVSVKRRATAYIHAADMVEKLPPDAPKEAKTTHLPLAAALLAAMRKHGVEFIRYPDYMLSQVQLAALVGETA